MYNRYLNNHINHCSLLFANGFARVIFFLNHFQKLQVDNVRVRHYQEISFQRFQALLVFCFIGNISAKGQNDVSICVIKATSMHCKLSVISVLQKQPGQEVFYDSFGKMKSVFFKQTTCPHQSSVKSIPAVILITT